MTIMTRFNSCILLFSSVCFLYYNFLSVVSHKAINTHPILYDHSVEMENAGKTRSNKVQAIAQISKQNLRRKEHSQENITN